MNSIKARQCGQELNNYHEEIWSTHEQHSVHYLKPLPLGSSFYSACWSNMGQQPGWGGRRGAGLRCGRRPLGLPVWLSTLEETCCSVTVMNDFAYPLIIAHSGAEKGPLIKMSWGIAGLHLADSSMPQQPWGRPTGIGLKRIWLVRTLSFCNDTQHLCLAICNLTCWTEQTRVEEGRGLH